MRKGRGAAEHEEGTYEGDYTGAHENGFDVKKGKTSLRELEWIGSPDIGEFVGRLKECRSRRKASCRAWRTRARSTGVRHLRICHQRTPLSVEKGEKAGVY